jgi:hypothetical protein
MTDVNSNPGQAGDDPLAHLHKMSTTAGLGTTDYAAVNGVSVIAVLMGVASALSLLDPVLLVIPLVALVLAIFAIWQIRQSNGTQTGIALAILGLVLALGFCGLVGGRALAQAARNRADEQAIDKVINDLAQTVRDRKYDQAYQKYFAEHFTSRFKLQDFTDKWKYYVEGANGVQGLTGMHSGRMEIQTNPDTGQKSAYCMTLMQFDKNEARIPFVLLKGPDGSWKISDIPDMFTARQPGPAPQARQ